MSDLKISQLPPASLPLDGSELVPLVQSGNTVQATVGDISNLTNPVFLPENLVYLGTSCGSISAPDAGVYRTISAPNLTNVELDINVEQGGVTATYRLEEINFQSLVSVGGNMRFNMADMQFNGNFSILNLSSLTTVGGSMNMLNLGFVTDLDLGLLQNIGGTTGLNISISEYLTSINLDSLESAKEFDLTIPLLSTLSLPSLITMGNGTYGFYFADCPNLTTVSFPNLQTHDGNVYMYGCAFTESTVDSILAKLVEIGLSDRTVDLSGGTSATPSVTGAADVATLISNGCTVTTN